MNHSILPLGEVYPFGGPGRFVLGKAQELEESLLAQYEGKVTLV